jgi:drug/metabolite transporter (DMT)-like permease
MEERNKGLIIFGIILLAIGLVASFYFVTEFMEHKYPYQSIGILLDVAGIVFVALG